MSLICSVLTYCSSFTSEGCVVSRPARKGKEGGQQQREAGIGRSLTRHNKVTFECVEADLIILGTYMIDNIITSKSKKVNKRRQNYLVTE